MENLLGEFSYYATYEKLTINLKKFRYFNINSISQITVIFYSLGLILCPQMIEKKSSK